MRRGRGCMEEERQYFNYRVEPPLGGTLDNLTGFCLASRQAGTSTDLLKVICFYSLNLKSFQLMEERQVHRGRGCIEEERQ